jgi:hypothetical protein
MPGSAMPASMPKRSWAGATRVAALIARLGLMLAIVALLTTPSQACGRHHAEARFTGQWSASLGPTPIIVTGMRMTVVDRCGLPGPADQGRCPCCSGNSPVLASARVGQIIPSRRPIEIVSPESPLASIDSIPELPPPISSV